RTESMPFLSMVRMAAVETRSFTQRFSLATQNRRSCRFGRKRRRVLLLAWETLLPVCTPLPVTWQTRDITHLDGVLGVPHGLGDGGPGGSGGRSRECAMRCGSVAAARWRRIAFRAAGDVAVDRPGAASQALCGSGGACASTGRRCRRSALGAQPLQHAVERVQVAVVDHQL